MIDVKNFTLPELINTSKVPITDNVPESMAVVRNLVYSAEILQFIRDFHGWPIRVNSGYRSKLVNRLVGGVPNSLHCDGRAFDLSPINGDVEKLYNDIKSIDAIEEFIEELIKYDTFIHVGFKKFTYSKDL